MDSTSPLPKVTTQSVTESPEKLNKSGPRMRKTLNSMRRQSVENETHRDTRSSERSFKNTSYHSAQSVESNGNATLTEEENEIDHVTDDEELTEQENQQQSTTPQPPASSPTRPSGRETPKGVFASATTPSPPQRSQSTQVPETGNNYNAALFILAVVLLAIGYWYKKGDAAPVKADGPTQQLDCEMFYTLEKTYQNVDNTLWDSLDVTFRRATTLAKRREPGTFLFLHNGATKLIDDFIENVTNITAACFGGTEPIVLGSKYFKRTEIMHDFGVFLTQYASRLKRQGIMVVRNLEDVPAVAVQAFHSICDPQEPLVDKAVIYFTLDISKVAGNAAAVQQSSATENAEKLLYQIWQDALKPEVLDPLIVRLTENVYRIN